MSIACATAIKTWETSSTIREALTKRTRTDNRRTEGGVKVERDGGGEEAWKVQSAKLP